MVAIYERITWFTDKGYNGYIEIPLISSCWMLKCTLLLWLHWYLHCLWSGNRFPALEWQPGSLSGLQCRAALPHWLVQEHIRGSPDLGAAGLSLFPLGPLGYLCHSPAFCQHFYCEGLFSSVHSRSCIIFHLITVESAEVWLLKIILFYCIVLIKFGVQFTFCKF